MKWNNASKFPLIGMCCGISKLACYVGVIINGLPYIPLQLSNNKVLFLYPKLWSSKNFGIHKVGRCDKSSISGFSCPFFLPSLPFWGLQKVIKTVRKCIIWTVMIFFGSSFF